ncbi:SDR family NAD(P)-dependent oxidoreductase, partial [Streptomyces longwoodensis]|uniref:SDR family NAD(P)-dependent oxidoreductase n=1 Tax=Streptomyces longwoodensis TaxID=68231 RepID=UPI003401B0DA
MSAPSTVLVTGGAGFIGSHACVELLDHGYEVIAVDDYSNSTPRVYARVERVAGRFVGAVYELDVRDRHALSRVVVQEADGAQAVGGGAGQVPGEGPPGLTGAHDEGAQAGVRGGRRERSGGGGGPVVTRGGSGSGAPPVPPRTRLPRGPPAPPRRPRPP